MENTDAKLNADGVNRMNDAAPMDIPTSAEAPEATEIEALKIDLENAKAEAAKNKDGWLRAVADFSNFKKRQEADNANVRAFATSSVISKVLPVLDDFDRAVKTLPESLRGMTWIDGILLVQRKMQLILESEGVKAIEVKPGDLFDPKWHEAVSHEDAEGIESGHVVEELQKGYKLGERVIRPTLVRVAR